MKKPLLYLLTIGIILLSGCGSSNSSQDHNNDSLEGVEAPVICTGLIEDNTTSISTKMTTFGSILYDCENDVFSIDGTDSITVINKKFTTQANAQYDNGNSWEGSESYNDLTKSSHIIGSHSTLGDYNCSYYTIDYLPVTIEDNQSIKNLLYSTDYGDSTSIGDEPCPAWVDDGTLDENFTSGNKLTRYEITDNENTIHTIVEDDQIKQYVNSETLVEYQF
ncbi:MAG: hypothetical protein U9N34_11095, partial [Candidatus Cloacimonadota bacterium]|nr:hypothetical protein [Candidatus Cloacimonadota bacterium]